MSKFILITIVLTSIIVTTSCRESKKEFKAALLEKSWTQSFEEKTSEGIEIYRPSDYIDFPIARFRQILTFHDNNVCEYLVLAENDAHYKEKGRWEYEGETNSIKVLKSNSEMLYEFVIIALTDNLLKLKPNN